MHPLFLRARGGLTYYVSPNFSKNFSKNFFQIFSQPTAIAPNALTKPMVKMAEIMEITLDNGRPGVLCCYQEDYHRRLDRPEGTWKRVIVHPSIYKSPTTNCRGNIEEPRAKRAGGRQAVTR